MPVLPLQNAEAYGKHLTLAWCLEEAVSRGPGAVQRRLRVIFAESPGEFFSTEELCQEVYRVGQVQKKHRVSVLRALKRLSATSMPWLWRVALEYERNDEWYDHRQWQGRMRGAAPATDARPRK